MWALKSPWISTFGICRNLLLYGNILFWLLSSTITTFITLQQTKINTSRLIHDRQWRNCVTTVTMAIWQSPKDNSRCAILKARVHTVMRLVYIKIMWCFPSKEIKECSTFSFTWLTFVVLIQLKARNSISWSPLYFLKSRLVLPLIRALPQSKAQPSFVKVNSSHAMAEANLKSTA